MKYEKYYVDFCDSIDVFSPKEFDEILEKFKNYLPEHINFNGFDLDGSDINLYILQEVIKAQLNNEDIWLWDCGEDTVELEGFASIEEADRIQEILDDLGYIWDKEQKQLEINSIN